MNLLAIPKATSYRERMREQQEREASERRKRAFAPLMLAALLRGARRRQLRLRRAAEGG